VAAAGLKQGKPCRSPSLGGARHIDVHRWEELITSEPVAWKSPRHVYSRHGGANPRSPMWAVNPTSTAILLIMEVSVEVAEVCCRHSRAAVAQSVTMVKGVA
jgi:hypothetical protein